MSQPGAPSPLDIPIAFTFFKNFAATEKTEEHFTLRGLAPRIRAVTAAEKSKLPWLKAARFGDARTDKNSLRHDANVITVSGIEVDYDGDAMGVDAAIEKLEQHGVAALIYTSPSHSEDTPRWRVVCPLSEELPPARREHMVGRLNGLFGGIFAGESFTLSQAYYYGSVKHNPSHRVELIDGSPIDAHDDLDEVWQGRPATTTRTTAAGERVSGPVDEVALLADITSGASYHASGVRLLGLWARKGVPYMDARSRLVGAFDAVTAPGRDARWASRRADVDRCLDDIYGRQARQRDTAPPPPEPPPHTEDNGAGSGNAPLRILSAADFMAGFEPPDYVIDGIIQRGRLYALTSPTGHGKTAVALYQGCMVAAGRNIGAIEVMRGSVVFLAGENPDDLRCRLYAACQAYHLDPATLSLYVLPGNFPLAAETVETLKQQIDALGLDPVLIVVDTAAAYFHGDNDNDNVQMGAYARHLRVLTTCKGKPAVLTPAHPVKNPDRDNLLPRGGGAFLNEIDGNLTLWASTMGETAALHWQGKIRGADFAPVNLALQQVKITGLTDRRGRPIVSIVATLQTDDEAEAAAKLALTDENAVLEWLRRRPGISIKDIALNSGWVSPAGSPHKGKVHRLLKALQKDKLASQHRGKWKLTEAGKKELGTE